MSDLSSVRKVYSQKFLIEVGKSLPVSAVCPSETASYQILIKNRLAGNSQSGRGKENTASSPPPPGLAPPIRSGGGDSNQDSHSNMNRPGSQWRQQPVFDSRAPRNVPSQPRENNPGSQNPHGANNFNRGMGQTGPDSMNGKRSMGGENGNRGLSSAEQQRLQFQKEREEIELERLKPKSARGASSDFMDSMMKNNVTGGRTIGYHDECDQLMEELAGNAGSGNQNQNKSSVTTQQSEQESPLLKRNQLLGAMGMSNQQPPATVQPPSTPPGMKKISLNNIFTTSSSSSVNLAPPPGMPALPIYERKDSNASGSDAFIHPASSYMSSNRMQGIESAPEYIGDFSMGSGKGGADDDYEISMRLIERMVFDDDDDDDNGTDKYPPKRTEQTASRYSFSDPINLERSNNTFQQDLTPLNMPQYYQQPPIIPAVSPRFASGQSLSVNSLFAAARIQGENNNGIVQMSPQPPQRSYLPPQSPLDNYGVRDRAVTDRSQSFDVLARLGHHQEESASHRSYDLPPQSPSTTLRPSQSPSTPYSNRNPATGVAASPSVPAVSSPFAFHSSSSGGGSSGGGSRRSNTAGTHPSATSTSSPLPSTHENKLLGNTTMSASSRLQLMKIQRGLTPNKTPPVALTPPLTPRDTPSTEVKSQVAEIKSQVPEVKTQVTEVKTQVTETKPPVAEIKPQVTKSAVNVLSDVNPNLIVTPVTVVGKDTGLQRISISDLFKSTPKVQSVQPVRTIQENKSSIGGNLVQ